MSWTLHISNYDDNMINPNGIIIYGNYSLSVQFSKRFANDKAYLETNQYIVILDGIVLNSNEMRRAYCTGTIANTLIAAYEKNGEFFMNELRGSFNGAFYDKQKELWILFINHYGDRPLFYYKNEQNLYISSDFNAVADFVKQSGDGYQPNEKAAYYILTYGYMIDDSTHIEGISRLMPGDYMLIQSGEIQIKPYFRFNNTDIRDISFEDAIEELNIEFRKAVKHIFDKDLEYEYKAHLADMSGGLDSRMVSWVAREMGYENITNICYAQSQSKEWKAALGVANALGNDFIFMPLDACNFMYDIDEIINLNYGLAIYAGITGGRRFLESLNNDRFGLEMTGQLGDIVIGTFVTEEPRHKLPQFNENLYSNYLRVKFNERLLNEYDNKEMFAMYKRGFLGALSTHIIRNTYTDVISPFYDVDFLSFCLSLPLEYRFGHRLYNAWIVRKYPRAAKIPTSRYDGSIKEITYWNEAKRKIKKVPGYLSRRLLRMCGIEPKSSPTTMNPMQYWYANDKKFREFILRYYHENNERVAPETKLHADIEDMFYNGAVVDKLLVLTVLAAYKRYDLWIER